MAQTTIRDGFLHHPKVLAAGDEAIGLYLRVLLWCNAQLTDGAIPSGVLSAFTTTPALAARLVAAGLWETTPTGWQMHDFLDHNPSRAAVVKQRAEVSAVKAAAGRKGGLASGITRAKRGTGEADAKQGASTAQSATGNPDTVYARPRASESDPPNEGKRSEGSSEGENTNTTTTTASPTSDARETPKAEVVVAASTAPQSATANPRDIVLPMLAKASKGRFDHRSGTKAMRDELIDRLLAYRPSRAFVERMGRLLSEPTRIWPWATRLKAGGFITVALLLGKADANGERDAALLTDLVGKAAESLKADAAEAAEEARFQAAKKAEMERVANLPPPPTPEEIAAKNAVQIAQATATLAALRAMKTGAGPGTVRVTTPIVRAAQC